MSLMRRVATRHDVPLCVCGFVAGVFCLVTIVVLGSRRFVMLLGVGQKGTSWWNLERKVAVGCFFALVSLGKGKVES